MVFKTKSMIKMQFDLGVLKLDAKSLFDVINDMILQVVNTDLTQPYGLKQFGESIYCIQIVSSKAQGRILSIGLNRGSSPARVLRGFKSTKAKTGRMGGTGRPAVRSGDLLLAMTAPLDTAIPISLDLDPWLADMFQRLYNISK